jgi:acetyltransferase-like isoleucine patch superfamily enzyme
MLINILRKTEGVVNFIYNQWVLSRNKVKVGSGLKINGRIYVNNRGCIKIGDNVTINSGRRFNPIGGGDVTRIIVYQGGELVIENNVGISNSTIVVQSEVAIENGVLIGGACNIWDTDFHSLNSEIRGTAYDRGKAKPIIIREKAFVGAHSILLKGTSIGARSIIGAGSVGSLRIDKDQIYKPW